MCKSCEITAYFLKVKSLPAKFTGLVYKHSGERKGKIMGKGKRNFQLIGGLSQNGILGGNILELKWGKNRGLWG